MQIAEGIQEFAPGLRKVKVHPGLLQSKATWDHLEEEGRTVRKRLFLTSHRREVTHILVT